MSQLNNLKSVEKSLVTPAKKNNANARKSSILKFPTTVSKSGETIKIRRDISESESSDSSSFNMDAPNIEIKKVAESSDSSMGTSFNVGLYLRAMSLNRKKLEITKIID